MIINQPEPKLEVLEEPQGEVGSVMKQYELMLKQYRDFKQTAAFAQLREMLSESYNKNTPKARKAMMEEKPYSAAVYHGFEDGVMEAFAIIESMDKWIEEDLIKMKQENDNANG